MRSPSPRERVARRCVVPHRASRYGIRVPPVAPPSSFAPLYRWATAMSSMNRIGCAVRSANPHRDTFHRGNETSFRMMGDRDQRIAFGIVGAETTFRDVVGAYDETIDLTANA